jgi:flagellin-like protein
MSMTSKRRGVSPVIATLLLIVIAVAAAVLTYIWVTGYMGKVTGTVEQTSTQQLQEKIKINAVSVSGTTVTLSVSNIGDTDVVISALYILTANGTTVCSYTYTTATPLPKGQTQDLPSSGFSCTGIRSGKTYIAKAVTSKGTEATYTFTAP